MSEPRHKATAIHGAGGCLGLLLQILGLALLVSSPVWGFFLFIWLTKGGS